MDELKNGQRPGAAECKSDGAAGYRPKEGSGQRGRQSDMVVSDRLGLDPRTKIWMMCCISCVAVFSSNILHLAVLGIITFLMVILMGVKLREKKMIFKATAVILAPLFIIQCIFTRTGDPLLCIGDFVLLRVGGLEAACAMCLRMLVILLSGLIVSTGQSRDYLLALTQCKMPYELAYMVMIGVHFVPVFQQEASDVMGAVMMKGTDLEKIPLRKKPPVYAKLLLPILAGSLERAKHMATAMEVRGFRAFPKRTYMRRMRMRLRDWVLMIVLLAAAVGYFVYLY